MEHVKAGYVVPVSLQHRRLEEGYLVFRPSLKLRNRTRLRLFSSSFLGWNSPWILKPRCTTKAELRTENLYPATWSSQLWWEMERHEEKVGEPGNDKGKCGTVDRNEKQNQRRICQTYFSPYFRIRYLSLSIFKRPQYYTCFIFILNFSRAVELQYD